MPPFTCTAHGLNLCMSNSTCETFVSSTGSTLQRCACPPGFEADNLLLHNPNCALPSGTAVAFGSVLAILSAGFAAAVARKWPHTRGRVRDLVAFCVVYSLGGMGLGIGIAAQNGFYELGCVALAVYTVSVVGAGYEFNALMMLPMFAAHPATQRRLDRTMRASFSAVAAFMAACLLALAGVCRQEDPSTYNTLLVSYIASTFLYVVAASWLEIHFAGRLAEALAAWSRDNAPSPLPSPANNGGDGAKVRATSSGNAAGGGSTPTHDEAIAKVKATRSQSVRRNVTMLPWLAAVPIVYGVLGSIPYYWVVVLVLFGIGGALIPLGVLVVARKAAARSGLAARSSKLRVGNTGPSGRDNTAANTVVTVATATG